jgi:two-component system, NarL family, sensor histidine kinase UhpB
MASSATDCSDREAVISGGETPEEGVGGLAAASAGSDSRLLRVPLLVKLLVPTCVLILAAVGACALAVLLVHDNGVTIGLFAMVALVTVGAAIPIQLGVLRLALSPVEILEHTAERIEGGDLSARAALSPLADPRLTRLTAVLNRLLDSLALERHRLRVVAANAFRAQETERVRIAYELEEECAQRLAGVLFRLRATRRATEPAAREQQFEQLRTELTEVLGTLRHFARYLHPPALRDLGVAAAIRSYARSLEETTGIHFTIDAEDHGSGAGEHDIALYRILQEAISNAVRHSNASSVTVRLTADDGWLAGIVQDDGDGFDIDALRRTMPCLGLFGMQERAVYARGTVRVVSAPGRGTCVEVRLPVARIEPEEEDRPALLAVPLQAGVPAAAPPAGVASLNTP